VFDVQTRRCTAVLRHSAASEVLRAAFLGAGARGGPVCTGGADGLVKLWTADAAGAYSDVLDLPHGVEEQVYVCETFGPADSSALLTASNDCLYVWDLAAASAGSASGAGAGAAAGACVEQRTFGSVAAGAAGLDGYGGPRNPDNMAYIFDAKPYVAGGGGGFHRTTAAALSDGTLRGSSVGRLIILYDAIGAALALTP
jgi:hypothetical protein